MMMEGRASWGPGEAAVWGERNTVNGLGDVGTESMEVDAEHHILVFNLLMQPNPLARARFVLIDALLVVAE